VRTWIAALVLVLVVTAAITVKLLVRRRAPMGGWFTDSPRSAGTLSVIGTMFAVMLAFVILLALQSYQRAKEGSNIEAIAVTELDSIAEVFESPSSDRLHGGLVCYARAVVEDEWPAMGKERSSELVESWIDKLGRESATGKIESAFLFPQMLADSEPGAQQGKKDPAKVDPQWTPHFMDYLFLAFNTSTAFSPTDTAVLSRWAKVGMMLQAIISLAIIAIIAARAINIL